MKGKFLANYGWEWDFGGLVCGCSCLRSSDVSCMDWIVRWGGGRRLSGCLPVRSVYADFYIRDGYWPDFDIKHLNKAFYGYNKHDSTIWG
ncbi:MAG: undecaprenyl diphosphate synthase family protein [Acidiferrobacter sp.]